MRRSNKDRSESMRQALMDAARALFIEKGYAETATPEIVALAGVTRGALYHHFEDKRALFRAVIEREAAEVAADIEASAPDGGSPRDAILNGTRAYFDAMARPGRTRLLLLDGPAVLGMELMRAIDTETAEASLVVGLGALLSGTRNSGKAAMLAVLLSAAFDRAALAIEAGADRRACEEAIAALIDGLMR
ncbi:TetR family transcriptional regulator [Hoeflea sp. BAL378]|uniref:TetR/AcrR family transcriptional regulator n=1 Tax=Hoeflea sp. BAL378 TaxID=1547437 RepID=UPI000512CDB5|nr:TetR/AcrR family transcriptional regulator [Hoeflea sp. BAL378]KGF70286.1 TetR family transcriptional regulator [Hoeflea sp. BAL378]